MGICRFRDSLFSAMIERMTEALLQRVRTSTSLRSYVALQWEVRPSCCRLPPSFVVHDKNLNLLHLFHVQDACQQVFVSTLCAKGVSQDEKSYRREAGKGCWRPPTRCLAREGDVHRD